MKKKIVLVLSALVINSAVALASPPEASFDAIWVCTVKKGFSTYIGRNMIRSLAEHEALMTCPGGSIPCVLTGCELIGDGTPSRPAPAPAPEAPTPPSEPSTRPEEKGTELSAADFCTISKGEDDLAFRAIQSALPKLPGGYFGTEQGYLIHAKANSRLPFPVDFVFNVAMVNGNAHTALFQNGKAVDDGSFETAFLSCLNKYESSSFCSVKARIHMTRGLLCVK